MLFFSFWILEESWKNQCGIQTTPMGKSDVFFTLLSPLTTYYVCVLQKKVNVLLENQSCFCESCATNSRCSFSQKIGAVLANFYCATFSRAVLSPGKYCSWSVLRNIFWRGFLSVENSTCSYILSLLEILRCSLRKSSQFLIALDNLSFLPLSLLEIL